MMVNVNRKYKIYVCTEEYPFGHSEDPFINSELEELGVLSESAKGWQKELNLISWNGAEPKYDLRDWAPDHEKMGKGITLTDEEFTKLKELMSK